MGLKALITLDLTSSTSEQREKFYDVLKKKQWHKIPKLTTAWKASFTDTVKREGAINTLRADLKEAKLESKIIGVEYAIQLSEMDIVVETI